MSRYVRRILRCGGRSPIINLLYATLFLVMISLVTTQLTDTREQRKVVARANQPAQQDQNRGREPIDLHTLIKNRREQAVDNRIREDIESEKRVPEASKPREIIDRANVGNQIRIEKPKVAQHNAEKMLEGQKYPASRWKAPSSPSGASSTSTLRERPTKSPSSTRSSPSSASFRPPEFCSSGRICSLTRAA
ncbi:hypothetical protein L596_018767 [Steinernema carpocapsae]|nr:hypothetical protein L596_018767 [Steinernema carpocapsae]